MKQLFDRKRFEREFVVGVWVFMKLHTYAQHSMCPKGVQKLQPKWFGMYQVLERIGRVA